MKAFLRNNWLVAVAVVVAVSLVVAALAYAGDTPQDSLRTEAPPVRGQLTEYSWEELSAIADEISACTNREDAIACAARYHLCAPDGSMDATLAKSVQLRDGNVNVALVDVWHDTRTEGGKAGLTFAFTQPVGEHTMNHTFEDSDGDNADSVGGWAASDMRAWLNGTFLNELPLDLRSRIVSVQKLTANSVGSGDELEAAGKLSGTGADWVSQTSDSVWLFSASELCGNVPAKQSLGVDSTIASVYAAEGEQYRLFADNGFAAFKPNEGLSKQWPVGNACAWWLRTKTLEFGDGFWLVGTDGTPLNGLGEDARAVNPAYTPEELWGPDHVRAVVPGFCL